MEANFESVVNLITQTGIWCATSYILGRYLIQDICDSICIGKHVIEMDSKEINWG